MEARLAGRWHRRPVGQEDRCDWVLGQPGDFTLIRTAANGQPAFAAYRRDRDGRYRAHALQVLTVDATSVARVVSFNQPELFALFGLPPVLPR